MTGHSCCCTNQCPACGQCCQVGCAHRGVAGQLAPNAVRFPPEPWQPPGQITVTPPALSEEDVRRIIRQELERQHGPR